MDHVFNKEEQRVRSLAISLQKIVDEFERLDNTLRASLLDEKFLNDADISELVESRQEDIKKIS